MHIRIVTFQLAGIDEHEYRRHAMAAAPAFREWPGLDAKMWLADRDRGTFGGVYLFDDAASARASRQTELFGAMVANPHFSDLQVAEFDVIDELTAVTT